MNKIKRTLSMLLSVAMVMTSLYVPAPVYAAEDEAVMTGGSEETVEASLQSEQDSSDAQQSAVEEDIPEVVDASEFENQIESESVDISSTEEDANVIVDLDNVEEEKSSRREAEEEILGYSFDGDAAEKKIGLNSTAVFEADEDLKTIASATKTSAYVSNPIYFNYEYDDDDNGFFGIGFYSNPDSVARYSASKFTFGNNSSNRQLEVAGGIDNSYFEFTVADAAKVSVWAKSEDTVDKLQIYKVVKNDTEGSGYVRVKVAGPNSPEYRKTDVADDAVVSEVSFYSDAHDAPYVLEIPAVKEGGVTVPATYRLATESDAWSVNAIEVLVSGETDYNIIPIGSSISHTISVAGSDYTWTAPSESAHYYESDPTARQGDVITISVDGNRGVPTVKDNLGETIFTVGDGITEVSSGKKFTFVMPSQDVYVDVTAAEAQFYKITSDDHDKLWEGISSIVVKDPDNKTKTITYAKDNLLEKIKAGSTIVINLSNNPGFRTRLSVFPEKEMLITYTTLTGYLVDDAPNIDDAPVDTSKPVEFIMQDGDVDIEVSLEEKAYKVYADSAGNPDDFVYTINSTNVATAYTPVVLANPDTNKITLKAMDTLRLYAVDKPGIYQIAELEYALDTNGDGTVNDSEGWIKLTESDSSFNSDGRFWSVTMPDSNVFVRSSKKSYYLKTSASDFALSASAKTGENDNFKDTELIANDDDGIAYVLPGDVVTVVSSIDREEGKRLDTITGSYYKDADHAAESFSPTTSSIKVVGDSQISTFTFTVPADVTGPITLTTGAGTTTAALPVTVGVGVKSIKLTGLAASAGGVSVDIGDGTSDDTTGVLEQSETQYEVKGLYVADDTVNFTANLDYNEKAIYKGVSVEEGTQTTNPDLPTSDTFSFTGSKTITEMSPNGLKVSATPYWNVFTQLQDNGAETPVPVQYFDDRDALTPDLITSITYDKGTGDGNINLPIIQKGYSQEDGTDFSNANEIIDGTKFTKLTFTVPNGVIVDSVGLAPYEGADETTGIVTIPSGKTYNCTKVSDTEYSVDLDTAISETSGYDVVSAVVLQVNYRAANEITVAPDSVLAVGTTSPESLNDKIVYSVNTGTVGSPAWSAMGSETISGHTFAKDQQIRVQPVIADGVNKIVSAVHVKKTGADSEETVTRVAPAYVAANGTWTQGIWDFTTPAYPVTITVDTVDLYPLTRETGTDTTIGVSLVSGSDEIATNASTTLIGADVVAPLIPKGAKLTVDLGSATDKVVPVLKTVDGSNAVYYDPVDATSEDTTDYKYLFKAPTENDNNSAMPGSAASLFTLGKTLTVQGYNGNGETESDKVGNGFTLKFDGVDAAESPAGSGTFTKKYAQGGKVSFSVVPVGSRTITDVSGTRVTELSESEGAYSFRMPEDKDGYTGETVKVHTEGNYSVKLNYVTAKKANGITDLTDKSGVALSDPTLAGLVTTGAKIYRATENNGVYTIIGDAIASLDDTPSTARLVGSDYFVVLADEGYEIEDIAITGASSAPAGTIKNGTEDVAGAYVYSTLTADAVVAVNVVPVSTVSFRTWSDAKINEGVPVITEGTAGYSVSAENEIYLAVGSLPLVNNNVYQAGTKITVESLDGYRIRNVQVNTGTVENPVMKYLKKDTDGKYVFTVRDASSKCYDSTLTDNANTGNIGGLNDLDLIVDVVPLCTITLPEEAGTNTLRGDDTSSYSVRYYDDGDNTMSKWVAQGYAVDVDESGVPNVKIYPDKESPKDFVASKGIVMEIVPDTGYELVKVEVKVEGETEAQTKEIVKNKCTISGITGNSTILVKTRASYILSQTASDLASSDGYAVSYMKSSSDEKYIDLAEDEEVSVYSGAPVVIIPEEDYRVISVLAFVGEDDQDPDVVPMVAGDVVGEKTGIYEYVVPEDDVMLEVTAVPLYEVTAEVENEDDDDFLGIEFSTAISSEPVFTTDGVSDNMAMAATGDVVTVVAKAGVDDEYDDEDAVDPAEVDWTTATVVITGLDETKFEEGTLILVDEGNVLPDSPYKVGDTYIWAVAGTGSEATLTFKLPEGEDDDIDIVISLNRKSYTVKSTDGVDDISSPSIEYGTVRSGETAATATSLAYAGVKAGEEVFIKVVANDGYELAADNVDELSQALVVKDSNGSPVTFEYVSGSEISSLPQPDADKKLTYVFSLTMPNDNIEVSGNFRERKYALTISSNNVTVSDYEGHDLLERYDYGETVKIKIVADEDYDQDSIVISVYDSSDLITPVNTTLTLDGDGKTTLVIPNYDVHLVIKADKVVYKVGLDDATKALILASGTEKKLQSVALINVTQNKHELLSDSNVNQTIDAYAGDAIGILPSPAVGYEIDEVTAATLATTPVAVTVSENKIIIMPGVATLEAANKAGYSGVEVSAKIKEIKYGVYADVSGLDAENGLVITGESDGDYTTEVSASQPELVGKAKFGKKITFSFKPDGVSQFDNPDNQIRLYEYTEVPGSNPVRMDWAQVVIPASTLDHNTATDEWTLTYTMDSRDVKLEAAPSTYTVEARPNGIDSHVQQVSAQIKDAGEGKLIYSSTVSGDALAARTGKDIIITPVFDAGYEIDEISAVAYTVNPETKVKTATVTDVPVTAVDSGDLTKGYKLTMPEKVGSPDGYGGVMVSVKSTPHVNKLTISGNYADISVLKNTAASGQEAHYETVDPEADGTYEIATDTQIKLHIQPDIDHLLAEDGDTQLINGTVAIEGLATEPGLTINPTGAPYHSDVLYDFLMPAGDVVFTVEPVDVKYAFFPNAEMGEDWNEYVKITPTPGEGVSVGSDIELTLEYEDGYTGSTVSLTDRYGKPISATSVRTNAEGSADVIKEVLFFNMPSGGAYLNVPKNARSYTFVTVGEHATVRVGDNASGNNRTGDKVTFTAVADPDYEIDSISVVSAAQDSDPVYYKRAVDMTQEEIEIGMIQSLSENQADKTWSFRQPADNIKIVATTKQKEYTAGLRVQITEGANRTRAEVGVSENRVGTWDIEKSSLTYAKLTDLHAGDVVEFLVFNDAGYVVDEESIVAPEGLEVKVSEPDEDEDQIISFTMPSEPHDANYPQETNVDVSFDTEPLEYGVTKEGTHTTVKVKGVDVTTAYTDEVVNFTAVADPDYEITSISVVSADENSDVVYYKRAADMTQDEIAEGKIKPLTYDQQTGAWSFAMPAEAVKVAAVAVDKEYSVSIEPATGAKATIAADFDLGVRVKTQANGAKLVTTGLHAGDVVTYIVTTQEGYEVDEEGFVVTGGIDDIAVGAADEQRRQTVSFTIPSEPTEALSVKVATKTVKYALTFDEDKSTISGVTEGPKSYTAAIEFTVAPIADHKLIETGAVRILRASNGEDVSANEDVNLHQANGKWVFNMPAYAAVISTRAEVIIYDVEIVDNDNVTVTAIPDKGVVGTTVTVSACYAEGYSRNSVSITKLKDGSPLVYEEGLELNTYVLKIPSGGAKVSITAKPFEYQVKSKETLAVISNLKETAGYETVVEFDVAGVEGYKLTADSVKILDNDGKDISKEVGLAGDIGTVYGTGHFSFNMPNQSVKVSVTGVRKQTYAIAYEYDETVVSLIDRVDSALENDTVAIQTVPIKGYDVKAVKAVDKDGKEIAVSKEQTIVIPESDVKVTVVTGRKANGETTSREDFEAGVSANYAKLTAAANDKTFTGDVPTLAAEEDDALIIQNFVKGKVKSITISENSTGDSRVTVNTKVKIRGLTGYTVVSAFNGTEYKGVSDVKLPKIDKKGNMKLKKVKNVPIYTVCLNGPKGFVQLKVVDVKFDPDIKNAVLNTNTVSGNMTEAMLVDVTDAALKSSGFLNGYVKVGKGTVTEIGKRQEIKANSQVSIFVTMNPDGTFLVESTGPVTGGVSIKYNLNGKLYKVPVKLSNEEIRPSKIPYREKFQKGFEANKNKIVFVTR